MPARAEEYATNPNMPQPSVHEGVLDGYRSCSDDEELRATMEYRVKKNFKSKETFVIDDGTNTFFWRAHSVTVLICMLAVFVYVALLEQPKDDTSFNTKRGILASISCFCLFGMTQAKDGPFKRPHPAFWRLVLCLSVVYELALVYLLFQTVDDARRLISFIDPKLGKPLPEQSYAEDCRLYDPEPHPDGHFHSLWEKADVFVIGHLAGWWVKMLIIRDYWLCNVMSILFEILEYSLEHQLPNFAECWWDHWLLDAIICNGLGIWLGMKTLNYLNASTYHWRGLWSIRTYGGQLKRIILQFTPYSWTRFDWHPTESLSRWLFVIGMVVTFEVAELNFFYLKWVLWIPPPHPLNFMRLILYGPVGMVALRETYQYLEDPECTKLGQQAWVAAAMVVTEVMIVLKFDLQLVLKLPSSRVIIFWSLFVLILVLWTIYFFFIRPYRRYKKKQQLQSKKKQARKLNKKETAMLSKLGSNNSNGVKGRSLSSKESPSRSGDSSLYGTKLRSRAPIRNK